jgi:hypothetical protein
MYNRFDETMDTVFEWAIFGYLNSSTLIWKVLNKFSGWTTYAVQPAPRTRW